MEPDFDVFEQRLRTAVGAEPLYGWATRIGISKGTLSSALTRRTFPNVEILAQIASALGFSLDFLLGLETEPPQSQSTNSLEQNSDPIADAIATVTRAYERKKIADNQKDSLTNEEVQLLDAFRVAGPERKEIFMDLARTGRKVKSA